MADLLAPIGDPYATINRSLNDVRELFHSKGRIADANAKLDETVKLMAVQYARLTGNLDPELYAPLSKPSSFTIAGLNAALREIASRAPFVSGDDRSIFGNHPSVAFESGEEELAFELFKSAGIAIASQLQASDPLDVVNEAFGHHIRDNFRSNTEDAQYMTPPEVVDFMVAMAKAEIFDRHTLGKIDQPFTVADPSCGVGSFLVAWHRLHEKEHKADLHIQAPKIVGQDKVDRMARFAKANLIFSGFKSDNIFVGSSIDDCSPISDLNGQVDLILTNPPFGARFSTSDLAISSSKSTPYFSSEKCGAKIVDSESLFVERYLTLLRPGGLCIVVLPDSIISAKGASSLVRQLVARSAEIVAVVELPPVTFAQAGTRTKTSILAFRKTNSPKALQNVFFAEAESLGFEVSKRKGVAFKRSSGSNELTRIIDAFVDRQRLTTNHGTFAEWVELDPQIIKAWTPRRFRQVDTARDGLPDDVDFTNCALASLVRPRAKNRPQPYRPGTLFISVLHVIGEGVLDLPAARAYRPITPGLPVQPGNVIISRINPRIPRVLVVPDLGVPLICSSEFEILEPLPHVSPYALAFLLLSGPTQAEIGALTAGTSASHSRVRPDEIRAIEIPWPSNDCGRFADIVAGYESANKAIISGISEIAEMRSC